MTEIRAVDWAGCTGEGWSMEKLLDLFRRKPGTTREAFHEHYVTVHSPLGMRLTDGLDGYTVNLVESDGADIDSVTEVWTPSVADLVSGKYYATPEDRQMVVDDHMSFMGPGDSFVVEETVVLDGALDFPGVEGPWAKVVTLHEPGDDPGDPPAGGFRVVDNRVVRTLRIRDEPIEDGDPDAAGFTLIRMIWIDRNAPLPASGPRTLHVRERRNTVLGS